MEDHSEPEEHPGLFGCSVDHIDVVECAADFHQCIGSDGGRWPEYGYVSVFFMHFYTPLPI